MLLFCFFCIGLFQKQQQKQKLFIYLEQNHLHPPTPRTIQWYSNLFTMEIYFYLCQIEPYLLFSVCLFLLLEVLLFVRLQITCYINLVSNLFCCCCCCYCYYCYCKAAASFASNTFCATTATTQRSSLILIIINILFEIS